MANPLPAVALPDDDVFYQCNVTMTNVDPAYPLENLLDPDPANVVKATTPTTTVTVEAIDQLGAPMAVTPVAVAVINTNADNIYVTDGLAGLIPITVPNRDGDDQRVHPWKNLTGLVPTQTTFHLNFQRVSGAIWIGRIALAVSLRPLNLRYGLRYGRNRPGAIRIVTRLGSVLAYDAGIRSRWAEGETGDLADEQLRHDLEASTKGQQLPFLFIPDEATNSAWWVRFRADDYTVTLPELDRRTIPFRVEELANGPVQL